MRNPRTKTLAAARWIALALFILSGPSVFEPLQAADPQPYAVNLKPTGDSALDSALQGSSTLISLQSSAPVSGFALAERARLDVTRFQTALQSFGYYKASVTTTIGGHKLDDPTVSAFIDQAPASPPLEIVIAFDLGPRFKLGAVTISPAVPPDIASRLDLQSGQPAMAAEVLAAQGRLLDALRSAGYPLAQVPVPVAILHPERNLLDIEFQPDAGPKATIGPITISGLKDMNESFVRQRLLLHQGEPYSPKAIETARQDLASLGVFAVVRVEQASAVDANGQLPITFSLSERPLHAVDLGAAYSTDLGVSLTAAWRNRNLFGNAEQLNLTAGTQTGGNASTRPGYNAGIQFLKPDYLARDQTLEISLNAIKQSLQAYEQTALIEKIALNRKLSEHWFASLGLSAEQESIIQEGETNHYNLVGIPASLRYDNTNSPFDPTEGIRANLSVTPTQSLGSPGATFFISQIAGSTYFDVLGTGRSIIALRGLVGKVSGTGVFGLPPDQRFYAGGSSTVRGYRYQSLGPQFADQRPIGGTAIAAGTVELRQRILSNYGVAAFVDVGQVTDNGVPFSGSWHAGAGVGARYYTAIGPIRLDVAVPLNKLPGGDSFELYIGIGQAF